MFFIISGNHGNMLISFAGSFALLVIYSYLTINPPKIPFFGISREETRQI